MALALKADINRARLDVGSGPFANTGPINGIVRFT